MGKFKEVFISEFRWMPGKQKQAIKIHRGRNQRPGGYESRGPHVLVKIVKKSSDIQGHGTDWDLS